MIRAERFIRFSGKYLTHISGPTATQPLIWEPWQVDWFTELLRDEPRYHTALLGVARGNGKSVMASALALYFLVVEGAEQHGAEIYSVAASLAQARIVFEDAKKMIQASALNDYCRIYRDAIEVTDTGAIYRVIPAGQPGKLHGLRPYVFIADEVHAIGDREVWDALATAQHKRPGSIGIGLSTAGFDLTSLLGDLYNRGKNGEDGFYFKWYEASDAEDVNTFKDANPASWISPEIVLRESKRHPWAVFQRLIGNLWTRTVEAWLPPGVWSECESDETIPMGEPIYVGLDLGFKDDHTAVVEVYRIGDRFVTKSKVFATHFDPAKPAPIAHHIFEEDRQSHRAVVDYILEVSKRNPITELVYDPYGATLLVEELEAHGILCVEMPQTNKRMTTATDILYGLITTNKLVHPGDAAFTAHIEACTTKWVGDGLRLWKDKDRQPMDSGIALAIATMRAYEVGDSTFNFYPL